MSDLQSLEALQPPVTTEMRKSTRPTWSPREIASRVIGAVVILALAMGLPGILWYQDWKPRQPVTVQPLMIPGTSTYSSSGTAQFAAVTEGPDGSIVAVGSSASDRPGKCGLGGTDAFVVRSGVDGKAWSRIYGGSDDDAFNDVAVQPDGTIIAVGYTKSNNGDFPTNSIHGQGGLIAALDPNGKVIWHKLLEEIWPYPFSSVALAPNGDIVVAGQTESGGGWYGPTGNVLLRFSAQGDLLWWQWYGVNSRIEFNSLTITATGNIVAAGYTSMLPSSDKDYFCAQDQTRCGLVIDVTSNGDLAWAKTVTDTSVDQSDGQFNSVTLSGNNIVAAGDTRSDGGWAVMLGPDGTTVWNKTFANVYGNRSEFTAVTPATNGNLILVGYGVPGGKHATGPGGAVIINLAPTGHTAWTHAFTTQSSVQLQAVTTTSDGHILAAGLAYSSTSGFGDAYLVALNSDGTMG